jgi:hypothetical protein
MLCKILVYQAFFLFLPRQVFLSKLQGMTTVSVEKKRSRELSYNEYSNTVNARTRAQQVCNYNTDKPL